MRTTILVAVLAVLGPGIACAESAEKLFDTGQRAFDARDYARAIEHWEASYQQSKEPGLLFNLAQANRLAGNCARALANYRQFVALDPTSDRRPLADDLVRELEGMCGSSLGHPDRQPITKQPDTRAVTTDAGRTLRIAGLVTGSGGAALVVTGLLFGRRAATIGDDVSAACAPSCDWSEQRDSDARGRRYATIGYVADGIGIAAIATGAVLYVIGRRDGGVSVVPRPREGGVGISWSASW